MEMLKREGLVCGVIWSVYVCYFCCATYKTSKQLESNKTFGRFLSEGWELLGRKQDTSDVEWFFWKGTLFPRLLPWFCVHIATSFSLKLLRLQQASKYCFPCLSAVFLITQIGFVSSMFFLFQNILVLSLALTTHSKPLTWSLSLFFLSFIFTPSLKNILNLLTNTSLFEESLLLDYLHTMGMLRYTSCALCVIDAIKSKDAAAVEKMLGIKIARGVLMERCVTEDESLETGYNECVSSTLLGASGSDGGGKEGDGSGGDKEGDGSGGGKEGDGSGGGKVGDGSGGGKEGDGSGGGKEGDGSGGGKEVDGSGGGKVGDGSGVGKEGDGSGGGKVGVGSGGGKEGDGSGGGKEGDGSGGGKEGDGSAGGKEGDGSGGGKEGDGSGGGKEGDGSGGGSSDWLKEKFEERSTPTHHDKKGLQATVEGLSCGGLSTFVEHNNNYNNKDKDNGSNNKFNNNNNNIKDMRDKNNKKLKPHDVIDPYGEQSRYDFADFNLSKVDWLVETDWGMVMAYNLYLPLLLTGPFLTYHSFCTQATLLRNLIKVIFWTLAIELSHHFLYHEAIVTSPSLMRRLPLSSVAGSAYLTGQAFMLKYFVVWTLTSSVSLLDGLVTPAPPTCISHVYLYSDMWKLFDKGFYEFLKCHIYIPLGGQRAGRARQALSLLVPFAFVFLWHGAEGSVAVWTVVNVFAIFLEKLLMDFYRCPSFTSFCSKNLSPENSSRLETLMVLPLFGLSTAGIFVFLTSVQASYVLVYRIFIAGFPWSFLHLVFVGYCFVQFSKSRKLQRSTKHHSN